MKAIGSILIVLGLTALLTNSDAPVGVDPAYALGQAIGPFLFMGVGWLLVSRDKPKG